MFVIVLRVWRLFFPGEGFGRLMVMPLIAKIYNRMHDQCLQARVRLEKLFHGWSAQVDTDEFGKTSLLADLKVELS